MLRIHFSPGDWAKTRVVSRPEPMWEIVLSLYMLADPSDELVFGPWRRRVLSRLPPESRMLLDLVPAVGYSPDFLSPLTDGHGLREGIGEVLNAPRRRIGGELDLLFGDRGRPAWTQGLARKEPRSVRELGRALNSYFEAALRPHWGYVSDAARDSAASVGTGGGPVAPIVRAAAAPASRSRPRTVELPFGFDQDLHLRGRGLLVIPAFFCATRPVTFFDPSMPPVLLYPVAHAPASFLAHSSESPRSGVDVLARLLGRTRAGVLRALGDDRTTGELARVLDISVPSASEHASLLRAAGLVASQREGNTVRHSLTALGLDLLHPTP
ncbi:ArsR/SmtB family transcription factor [Nocardiopsis mangrovi]|uniref:ArsR/SmtB family transcription factor n=1 Tax=Nocardiopsis mangrovi TaxID=1179818 RepID=A0ABV9E331_9ACTN